VVDALLKAFDRARDANLRANARKAIGEAISELIRISPDLSKAEAKIAIARAAGILEQDLFTAERMLKKVRKSIRKGPAKKPAGKLRKRKPVAGGARARS
jgi:D-serine dehydratase